jgi:two-component system sensor histidine kinase KdpD
MEAMGGSIAAEDTPGGGLTIVLELPRWQGQPEQSDDGAQARTADRMLP